MNQQPDTKHTQDKEPKRAVCYVRVASSSNLDGGAIARQRIACEHLAQELGLDIVSVYTDIGRSGIGDNRPGLQRMLRDLGTTGGVDVVLTQDAARISRNMSLLQRILTTLQSLGIEVRAPKESPLLRAMNSMHQVMAQAASEEYSQRIKDGLARRRQHLGAAEAGGQ